VNEWQEKLPREEKEATAGGQAGEQVREQMELVDEIKKEFGGSIEKIR
jgi:hypothetical protein